MQYAGGHHHNTTEQGKDVQALRRRSASTSIDTADIYRTASHGLSDLFLIFSARGFCV